VLIAVAVATGLVGELLVRWDATPARAVPLAVTAGAALAFRRSQPVPAFIVCWLALFGLAYTVRGFDNGSTTFVFAYFISFFSLGAHARGREVVAAVVLVVIGIATFAIGDGDTSVGGVVFAGFFVGAPWATGLVVRLRADLAERNAELKREQE
jgi:hypothetical protein